MVLDSYALSHPDLAGLSLIPPSLALGADRTLVVWGDGANVMCSCKVQSQETVYYGLPESEHPDGSLPLHVTWIDGTRPFSARRSQSDPSVSFLPEHDGKLRRNAAVKIEFVDKIVDQHNMVQQTRFAVLQAFEDMELPVELCGVEHGIFSHQRSVVLGSH